MAVKSLSSAAVAYRWSTTTTTPILKTMTIRREVQSLQQLLLRQYRDLSGDRRHRPPPQPPPYRRPYLPSGQRILSATSHAIVGGGGGHGLSYRRYHSAYEPREELNGERLLTTQEVATALRPFYFTVHPDRFWRFPSAKDTNEDSLKQLNAYIDDAVGRRERSADRLIKFFVRRDTDSDVPTSVSAAAAAAEPVADDNDSQLKEISISLLRKETVNRIVHRILSECKLSTDYLQRIGKQPKPAVSTTTTSRDHRSNTANTDSNSFKSKRNSNLNDFWINFNRRGNAQTSAETDAEDDTEEFIEFADSVRRRPADTLRQWLGANREQSDTRRVRSEPIRQEFHRLADELTVELGLSALVWKDCGWGVTHVRGALKSVHTLSQQFAAEFGALRGRTLAFGRQTGVTFDGHIVLNIEDVRHNWLDLIRNIGKYDEDLRRVPAAEAELSAAFRGIRVVHRKFRPSVLVKSYVKHVRKLTAALDTHIKLHGYPRQWPPVLDAYRLVVECEAGPLMLSPTGQFIVPASCPAGLLFDFVSTNLFKSRLLSDMYAMYKSREDTIVAETVTALGLLAIEKDDNVTPDLMIDCCQRLLTHRELLSWLLRDSRLRVSHYYSVLLDGEICIPWNFTV